MKEDEAFEDDKEDYFKLPQDTKHDRLTSLPDEKQSRTAKKYLTETTKPFSDKAQMIKTISMAKKAKKQKRAPKNTYYNQQPEDQYEIEERKNELINQHMAVG